MPGFWWQVVVPGRVLSPELALTIVDRPYKWFHQTNNYLITSHAFRFPTIKSSPLNNEFRRIALHFLNPLRGTGPDWSLREPCLLDGHLSRLHLLGSVGGHRKQPSVERHPQRKLDQDSPQNHWKLLKWKLEVGASKMGENVFPVPQPHPYSEYVFLPLFRISVVDKE